MSVLSPTDVVRRIFEARATGDVRRVMALLDPDVVAEPAADLFAQETATGRRLEAEAHRVEEVAAGVVHVHGRLRVITPGSLADSPAAWRFEVRRGRVSHIAPLPAEVRLRHVA